MTREEIEKIPPIGHYAMRSVDGSDRPVWIGSVFFHVDTQRLAPRLYSLRPGDIEQVYKDIRDVLESLFPREANPVVMNLFYRRKRMVLELQVGYAVDEFAKARLVLCRRKVIIEPDRRSRDWMVQRLGIWRHDRALRTTMILMHDQSESLIPSKADFA